MYSLKVMIQTLKTEKIKGEDLDTDMTIWRPNYFLLLELQHREKYTIRRAVNTPTFLERHV